MRKPLYPSLLSLICLVLLTVSPVQGQYLLINDVLSESGGHAESDSYLLDYSSGQTAVGQSQGEEYTESGGFWGWPPWGPEVSVEEQIPEHVPQSYALSQNYPNPFNPQTSISYQIPQAGHVSLVVFNVTGQEVCRLVDWEQTSGDHIVTWNGVDDAGRPVASGIYLYQLICGDFQQVRKMLLLK